MKYHLLTILCLLSIWPLCAKIDILQQSAADLTVQFELPKYQLQTQGDFTAISCPELSAPTVSGAPSLPFMEYKIAVPQGGSIQVKLVSRQNEQEKLSLPVQPVPAIVPDAKKAVDTNVYTPNPVLYKQKQAANWSVSATQQYQGMEYVILRITPFNYDDSHKILDVNKELTFQVHINGNVESHSLVPNPQTKEFMSSMLNKDANYSWPQTKDLPTINYADFGVSDHWYTFEANQDGMYALTYNDLSALPLADIDPDSIRIFTTGGAVLSSQSAIGGLPFKEIPILVEAGNDHQFNPGDRILLYARDRDDLAQNQAVYESLLSSNERVPVYYNPYSQPVVYWLTFSGSFHTSPKRIVTNTLSGFYSNIRTTHPVQVRLETDRLKNSRYGFGWFQSVLTGSTDATYRYNFNTEHLATPDNSLQLATVSVQRENLRTASHRIQMSVNSQNLIDTSWTDGYETTIKTATGSGHFCVAGANEIQFTVKRTSPNSLFLDYFLITYPQQLVKDNLKQLCINYDARDTMNTVRYEVSSTDTEMPKVFQVDDFDKVNLVQAESKNGGFAFVATANPTRHFYVAQTNDYLSPQNVKSVQTVDLTAQMQSVQNIIITPAGFKSQADALSSFYQQQWGVKSLVVDQQDIFNQFNAGMPDPVAIRQFLRYCYFNYPGPPISSVTLLGAGTNDWRNFSGAAAAKNKIMVYEKAFGTYGVSSTASDDYFAIFSPNSNSPEIAVGRYPAHTTSELEFMINRTIAYATQANPGWWRNSLVFMADDLFNGDVEWETYHATNLEANAADVNRSILVEKIFGHEYDFDEFQNKPKARDDIADDDEQHANKQGE
jgi:hypothetical protein